MIGIFITLLGSSFVAYSLFFDMERLPKGELLTESASPNGDYVIRAYVAKNDSTESLRGELLYHQEGTMKTIYWNKNENTAVIRWIEKDTVIINGHILQVPNETYDHRWD
ncbi:hypothetical protein Q73_06330 [Bacillus coahuilensis m2-6]|uniref:DUF5412 family protein n=1 Tax=Bacillus coahuilensis TaxID=408580 RepID=UPI0007503A37|nr:DUF5412 family protein [Bacillus coahuilensis]KUP08358.1 hypothetical protein Q73_06330 [Bacillus coahuilensis m2-6]